MTRTQLGTLTRADVVWWVKVKTYGVTEPDDDANPIYVRSSTILY